MDEKTKERVHEIAKALKELHLAANMEEALARAKEIVESAQENGKSIKDLMGDMKAEASEQSKSANKISADSDKTRAKLSSEAHEEHKHTEHNIESASKDKAVAKQTKENVGYDVKVHKLESGDVKEATREVDDIECATKDAEFIVKESGKVKKKK